MYDQQEQPEEQRLFGDALGDRDRRFADLRRQRPQLSRGEQALKLSAGGFCPRAIDYEDGGWISRHFSLKVSALPVKVKKPVPTNNGGQSKVPE
jgi:hypothetical protein